MHLFSTPPRYRKELFWWTPPIYRRNWVSEHLTPFCRLSPEFSHPYGRHVYTPNVTDGPIIIFFTSPCSSQRPSLTAVFSFGLTLSISFLPIYIKKNKTKIRNAILTFIIQFLCLKFWMFVYTLYIYILLTKTHFKNKIIIIFYFKFRIFKNHK